MIRRRWIHFRNLTRIPTKDCLTLTTKTTPIETSNGWIFPTWTCLEAATFWRSQPPPMKSSVAMIPNWTSGTQSPRGKTMTKIAIRKASS